MRRFRPLLASAMLAALAACEADAPPASKDPAAAPADGPPAGTYAEVTVDETLIRREPGDRAVVSTLYAGEWILTTAEPVELDGEVWLRVQYAADGFGWLGLDPDKPNFEATEPTCPEDIGDRIVEVSELVDLTVVERQRCFEDRTIRLSPVTWRTIPSDLPFGGEPDWLADSTGFFLGGRTGSETGPELPAHVDPRVAAPMQDGLWGEIQGQFEHPSAADCERRIDIEDLGIVDEEAFRRELVEPTPEESVLWCRQQFVITAVKPIPAPPPIAGERTPAAGGTWRRLPDAPIAGRAEHAAVWTGTEMIVWGGSVTNENAIRDVVADGAAFDPAANTWRVIAESPIDGRALPGVVWTGQEVIIFGGMDADFGQLADGAAYDPEADAWRIVAEPPDDIPPEARHAWTGDELVVLLNASRAVAYDPDADAWTELPPVPLPVDNWALGVTWTGDEIIAIAHPNGTTTRSVAAALRPGDDAWRRLPDSPVVALNAYPPIWIGDEMAVISRSLASNSPDGVPPETTYIAFYDPGADAWRTAGVQEVHQEVGESIWTGELLLTGSPFGMAAYDPVSDTWLDVPDGPEGERGSPVWTGTEVLWWGGRAGGESALRLSDGAAYEPGRR